MRQGAASPRTVAAEKRTAWSEPTRLGVELGPGAPRVGHWPATVAITALAAALYLAFVGYGYNLEDEGTILFQIYRTYRGQRPYLDFHTGYTPAMFYLNAALFDLFGVSVVPIRLLLVLVNSLGVALIFRLALRLAPVAESACAAATYAVFMPFFTGQFASFNIPYPAWYATTCWLATELASMRAVESGRRGWLFAAGACAGLAFSFKPNTGVLALGAAVLAQCLASRPASGWLGAALESALLAAAALGVAATLSFDFFTPHFALLGVPILLLLGGAVWLRQRMRRDAPFGTRPLGVALVDALTLLAGFVAVVSLWLAYYLPRLGLDNFLREVLLVGAGVERIYLLYYPETTFWTGAFLVAVVALNAVPSIVGRGLVGRRHAFALLALGAVLASTAFALLAYAPEGLVAAVVLQLENTSFFLIPLVLTSAVLAWLGRSWFADPLDEDLRRRGAVAAVAIVYGLLLFLQLYPRIDFMHVVISMASALVVAAGVLSRAERWWLAELGARDDRRPGARRSPSAATRRAFGRWRAATLVAIVAVLALRLTPMLDARLQLAPLPRLRPMTSLDASTVPVAIERDRDHELRELRAAAGFVRRQTRADEPIVTFPALAMVSFLSGRMTPVPHDYFFAGRPDHADEAAMVATIDAARPPLLVTLNDRLGYFSASPAYYFVLRDYVQRNYVLVRRYGRYDVLMRRDRAAQDPESARLVVAGGGLSPAFARGRYRQVIRRARRVAESGGLDDLAPMRAGLGDVDRFIRQASIFAITGVAARAPGGLPAAAGVVTRDRATTLLFLRGLGEFGDQSAFEYLVGVYMGAPARVQREAATAINYILARRLAARFTLASPAQGPLWTFSPALATDWLDARIDDPIDRYPMGPLAALAMARAGRRERITSLEGLFGDRRADTWLRVTAASALLNLGERRHSATLFATLNHGTLAAQYVPSMMLDDAIVARDDTLAGLLQALREGTPEERETVAWMAPYLDAPELAGEVERAASADASPAVRHAAQWATAARKLQPEGRDVPQRG